MRGSAANRGIRRVQVCHRTDRVDQEQRNSTFIDQTCQNNTGERKSASSGQRMGRANAPESPSCTTSLPRAVFHYDGALVDGRGVESCRSLSRSANLVMVGHLFPPSTSLHGVAFLTLNIAAIYPTRHEKGLPPRTGLIRVHGLAVQIQFAFRIPHLQLHGPIRRAGRHHDSEAYLFPYAGPMPYPIDLRAPSLTVEVYARTEKSEVSSGHNLVLTPPPFTGQSTPKA